MPNLLVAAVVFVGGPLFFTYKCGVNYAKRGLMSSQEVKPKYKAHKREMVRRVWEAGVANLALKLGGKPKND